MPHPLLSFLRAESGAVTVDWVVLTGLAVAFGFIAISTLTSGPSDMAGALETEFTAMDVADLQVLGVSE